MKPSNLNFAMTIVIRSGLTDFRLPISCKSFKIGKACRRRKSWYKTRNRKCAWYDFYFTSGSVIAGRRLVRSSPRTSSIHLPIRSVIRVPRLLIVKEILNGSFEKCVLAQVMEPKRLMNEFIKSKIETKQLPFQFDKTNKYRIDSDFIKSLYSGLSTINNSLLIIDSMVLWSIIYGQMLLIS